MKQEDKKMTTPIADFVRNYAGRDISRFHMPGHKGKPFLGCEPFDITEVYGADSLYEAEGMIAESEKNTAKLFGSACTLFSTEGSSQCIRAMLYLALFRRKPGVRSKIVAARNVHKAFVYAAALLDFDVIWLWPEEDTESICSCPVSLENLERVLKENQDSVVAVYVTSPDYLGGLEDIRSLAEVCHRNGTILEVDNAHGAYLHFLEPSQHPLDLGADICCDSAHKTLPVLTGGAYLHISKQAPVIFAEQAKYAMGLFGSTSPSYLILTSLDLCNRYLAENYRVRLRETIERREGCRKKLEDAGWRVCKSDPLKLTVEIPSGVSSEELTGRLHRQGVECEYADSDFLIFMLTPENTEEELEQLLNVLGENPFSYEEKKRLPFVHATSVMSIREAMFALPEKISTSQALGRICRIPTVSCPPAIPITVPGETIDEVALQLFAHYGINKLDVVQKQTNHAFLLSPTAVMENQRAEEMIDCVK